jgi:long-chain acyl-CoA synthetase
MSDGPDPGATSLPALLLERARQIPGRTAYRHKRLGVWDAGTWASYAADAAAVGLALDALGVRPGDRVAVAADNRPEWLIADLGIQGIGAVTVGVYPTSPASEVEYLLAHSGSRVVVCEDEEQLDKVMESRHALPDLVAAVVVDTRGVRNLHDPLVRTWADVLADGRSLDPKAWEAKVEALDPGATAMIVYTSGTTGPPKGAELTSRNLVAAGASFGSVFSFTADDEVLSYLPLCHIAERLTSLIDPLVSGYVVNFGEGGTSFPQDLREVQPTLFLGVPRVWEKMLAATEIRMADASFVKRSVYRWCTARGRAAAARRFTGTSKRIDPLLRGVCWLLCFRQLRRKLGLGRVTTALSGAAPISPQVLEWFWAIGVEVREGYGQTEGTAVATFTPAGAGRAKLGTVGVALPGTELRIATDGEVLIRSAAVFKGYLHDEQATRQTIDAEGWLHTGDVGVLDDDGYLRITDRKKDIIITAGGKNISPSEIENRLKVSPFVREAVVVGDRRKYLVALIGIELDTVGAWAGRHGVRYTTYADLATKPEVEALVRKVVEEVNAGLAQAETVKRFALLPKELGQEEGELTATMKVKRKAIEAEFAPLIESLYTAPAADAVPA